MKRINLKIDLLKLKSVTQWSKGKTGPVECIVIPIDANNIYRGKSGLYLDMTAFELREPKDNQTHLIKQSLPKEVFDTLTEEEKKAIPILGNANVVEVQETTRPAPLNEIDDLPY